MTKLHAGVIGLVLGAVVATVVTFAVVGRSRASAATPTASTVTLRAPCPAIATTPTTAPTHDEQQVEKLETENAQQAAMISSNPDGVVPAAYPDELPDVYRERSFRATIEEALRDCVPRAKLAGMSCEEPPCVAVIALQKPANADDLPEPLDRCAAWKRVYGRESRSSTNVVDCGDGRKESVLVISPELETWSGWKALDDDAREHITEREWPRTKNLLASYHCAPR